jgi:hypothetical protein
MLRDYVKNVVKKGAAGKCFQCGAVDDNGLCVCLRLDRDRILEISDYRYFCSKCIEVDKKKTPLQLIRIGKFLNNTFSE